MALTIKQNIVKEDLVDENGNRLGELKFNPNDTRIMQKLTKIVNDLTDKMKDLKKMDIPSVESLKKNKLEEIEDFEKFGEDFSKLNEAFDLEEQAIDNTIKELSDIFGEDTINVFTGGTKDIETLTPLLDFVMPYVKKAREGKVKKYTIKKEDADVME
ncbi:MAG: hypothetical protein MR598_03350 [Erysipelotrichaceae bacterium]|nr:hypothetical protein [Erysipelotrichaceae bacterium]